MNFEKYRLEIINLFRSKTVRNTGFVFAGNLAGQGIGFLATLILIRNLGPARFGLFSTAIAVMGLASQFSDLGISTGFVRFASLYLKEDQRKADILFKITLYLKLGVGLSVLLFGLLISQPLAVYVFKSPELTPLLRLAFVGSLGATLWGYLQAILQAREWFIKYAWINVFNNTVKLAGILLLLYYQNISESSALLVIALVPFAGFFIDGLIVPKGFIKQKAQKEEYKLVLSKLFHFSKWITLATMCTMLITRIDIFFLQSLSISSQVGIYNSSLQLAMIFPLITGSITTTLMPKVSGITDKEELRAFTIKSIKLIPYLLLLVILILISSGPIIRLIFGLKYLESIGIFRLLVLGFMFGVFINQISLVAFNLNKVKFLTMVICMELIINIVMDYFLVPHYGAYGAACANLTIKVIGNIIICWYIFRLLEIKWNVTKTN